MAKEFAKAFYKSKAWLKCRESYIAEREAIDGGICETCHEQPGYIVHHKILLAPDNINNPDISLNHSFLKYDCKDCHDKEDIHPFRNKTMPLVRFDSDGQPLPPKNKSGFG